MKSLNESILDSVKKFFDKSSKIKDDDISAIEKVMNELKAVENSDHTYSVSGDVKPKHLKKLISDGRFIVKFKRVNGDFDCSGIRELTSLENSPEIVDGDFICNNCSNLKTLKGAPKTIGGNFECSGTPIETLEGCPEVIGNWLECIGCKSLKSLEGFPKKVKTARIVKCGKDFTRDDIPKGDRKIIFINQEVKRPLK